MALLPQGQAQLTSSPVPQPSAFGTIAHRHLRRFVLRSSFSSSSFKGLSHFSRVPGFKNAWLESANPLKGVDFIEFSCIAFSARCSSCLCFFSNKDPVENFDDDEKKSYIKTPNKRPFDGRLWTNVLLNVLVYVAQIASQGKLILMGAKINSLIDKGEFWRLATSSFLHASVGHLMVSIIVSGQLLFFGLGPTMEKISGPRRFLAICFISAIASSAMSYWFCKAPAVGAFRSHFWTGGLLGGVAISWFVGPAWKYEPRSKDGILAFADKAPIFCLRKAK